MKRSAEQGGEPHPKRLDKSQAKRYLKPRHVSHLNQLRGMAAIMCTCNSREDKRAVEEAVDLLEEYVDKLWPRPDEDYESVEAFQASRRVVARDLQVQGLIYLTLKDLDPVRVVQAIIAEVKKPTHLPVPRLLVRFMPLSVVCYASVDDVKTAAKPLVDAVFKNAKTTYAVSLKRRNNSDFPRQDAIDALALLVSDKHTVDLVKPQVTILVEVFKSIAGIAVIPGFADDCDFNFRRIRDKVNADAKAAAT